MLSTTLDRVSEPTFGGMTVNERLLTAGLLGHWDAAIEAGQREDAIALLMQVEMSEDGAAATVDAVLSSPSKYGFPRS
jgi:hypothetical protein